MDETRERDAELAGDEARTSELIEDFMAGLDLDVKWRMIDDEINDLRGTMLYIEGLVTGLQLRVNALIRELLGEVRPDER